jgi:hypothetical protein
VAQGETPQRWPLGCKTHPGGAVGYDIAWTYLQFLCRWQCPTPAHCAAAFALSDVNVALSECEGEYVGHVGELAGRADPDVCAGLVACSENFVPADQADPSVQADRAVLSVQADPSVPFVQAAPFAHVAYVVPEVLVVHAG